MAHKPDRLDLVTRADINRELARRMHSEAARILGGATSAKKKAASRTNALLGGRPRKWAPCLYNASGYHTFAYPGDRCPCGLTLSGEWVCRTHDEEVNRYRAECWQRDQIQARWEKLEEKKAEEEEEAARLQKIEEIWSK